jgi:hypothetical protein
MKEFLDPGEGEVPVDEYRERVYPGPMNRRLPLRTGNASHDEIVKN